MTARELKAFLDALPPEKLELPVYYFVEYGGFESGAYGVRVKPKSENDIAPSLPYPERIFIA